MQIVTVIYMLLHTKKKEVIKMGGVEKKVRVLAEALGVDWEVVEDGRDVLREGQRIVKTIRYPRFGLKNTDEILSEYRDLKSKYDFNKLIYRVSSLGGHSRMYLVKVKSFS